MHGTSAMWAETSGVWTGKHLFSADTNTDLSELGSGSSQLMTINAHISGSMASLHRFGHHADLIFLDSEVHEPKPPHPTLQIHYFGCQNSTATTRLLTNCRLKATVQLGTSAHKGHAAAARPVRPR